MSNGDQLLSPTENLQIEALKAGATEQEASLAGKLNTVQEIPVERSTMSLEGPVSSSQEDGITVGGEPKPITRYAGEYAESGLRASVEGDQELNPFLSVLDAPEGSSIPYLQKRAIDLLMLKSSIDPLSNPADVYEDSYDELSFAPDQEQVFERYRQMFAEQQARYVQGDLENKIKSGQITTPEQLQESVQNIEDLKKEYEGQYGEAKAFVDANAPVTMEQVTRDSKAVERYAFQRYQEFADQQGFTEKWLSDTAGLLLLPDFIKDVSDLVGSGFIKSPTQLKKIVKYYQSLSGNKKKETFDLIWDKAIEAFEGNHWKLLGLISILHDPDFKESINLEVALAAFDVVSLGIGSIPFKAIKNLSKATKINKALKEVGAVQEAAEATITGITDEVGNVVSGSKLDSAISQQPWDYENTFLGVDSTDGLSPEVLKLKDSLKRDVQSVEKEFEPLTQEGAFVKVGALEDVEKQSIITQTAINAQEEAAKIGVDLDIKNIKLLESNERGFTLEYTLADGKAKETKLWSLNDVGTYESVDPNFKVKGNLAALLGEKILSPELRLATASEKLVPGTTETGRQAARIKNEFTRIYKDLNKDLSRKERISVNELLLAGDEYLDLTTGKVGKVFSISELLNGVELRSGTKAYSPKEIRNYYKRLAYNKELWRFRNHTVKRKLELLGAKELRYKVKDSIYKTVGIPKKDWRGIKIDNNELIVIPGSDGKIDYISGLQFNSRRQKYLDEGYLPVQLLEGGKKGNKQITWAFHKNQGEASGISLKNLPDQVLRYEGLHYIPRIRKEGYYYIKDAKFDIDGNPVPSGSTLIAAASKEKAKQWIKDFNAQQDLNEVPTDKRLNPQVFRDRELSAHDLLLEDANQYGGLYTGSRKSERLTDTEGNLLERLPAGDATQRYIDSLSDAMALDEFKMGMVERWKNQVDAIAKADNKPFGINPNADWKTTPILVDDAGTRKVLEQTRDYMLKQFKIWSKDERSFNRYMMDTIEHMNGRFGLNEKLHDAAVTLAHTDPIKNLRGATFGLHLGWFNPRQLYVQAQNASLAISMHPVHGVAAITDSMYMRPLMYLADSQLESAASKIAQWTGKSAEDLITDVRAFKKSGMQDAILRVADNDTVEEGFTPGLMNTYRNLSDKGLMFYKEGELSSRLNAWNVAKRKWKSDNKGKKIDNAAIKLINAEADRIHINFQRENASWWQQNALGITGQFFQIQQKVAEKIIPALIRPLFGKKANTAAGQWTAKEAAQVLAGQIVLYGTLGVPIAEEFTSYMMDVFGVTPEELEKNNPLIYEQIQDGMMGVIFQMAGFENTFGGDTASILAGMDDNVVSGIILGIVDRMQGHYGGDSFAETVMGPTFNTAGRGLDAITNLVNNIGSLFRTPNVDTLSDTALDFVSDFAAMTSTWSNARKVMYLHSLGGIYSKKGNKIISMEDVSGVPYQTIIARAMGIPFDIETAYWAQKRDNISESQRKADTKNALKQAFLQYSLSDNKDRFLDMKHKLLSEYTEATERDEILMDVAKEILKEESESDLDRQVKTFLQNLVRSGGRAKGSTAVGDLIPKERLEEENK